MKILFCNPPWFETDKTDPAAPFLRQGIRSGSRWPFTRAAIHAPGQFRFGGYIPFPFFLGHAASNTAALVPDAQVTFRDSIARGESYVEFFRAVAGMDPSFIVIETATPSWDHDRNLIKQLERVAPDASVILAGTLDATKAAEILRDAINVIAVVQGEFDKQIAKVINGARGLIPHDLLTVAEMNAAPGPMFDEACALNYWDACPIGNKAPQLQLLTSRGCPFKCIFCVWPAVMTGNDPDGTKPRAVRNYSSENVRERILARIAAAAKAGQKIESIYLDDDTFNLSDKHALGIAEVMGQIGLPWSAMCRADTVERSTWNIMKKAGCTGVKIGFESGCQDVVDRIVNKRLDVAAALETARFLSLDLGISVHGTFTVGLPGETVDEANATRHFIAEAMVSGAINSYQLSGTAEIEGTPLHTLRSEGKLARYARAELDPTSPVVADGQKKIEGMR